MTDYIKEIVKPMYRFVRWHILDYLMYTKLILGIKTKLRKAGILRNDVGIQKFKNIHKGETCFVVATGPSLKIEDLDVLEKNNVTCLSMNSIVYSFSKTKWRPKYYFMQDRYVFPEIKDELLKYKFGDVFFSQYMKGKLNGRIHKFTLYKFNHGSPFKNKKQMIGFSDDPSIVVYDATVAYAALQMAIYMGFKKIYLLGADCGAANSGQVHFISYGSDTNAGPPIFKNLIDSYALAREYCDKHNIEIYNATRGGALEVFERVEFDALF